MEGLPPSSPESFRACTSESCGEGSIFLFNFPVPSTTPTCAAACSSAAESSSRNIYELHDCEVTLRLLAEKQRQAPRLACLRPLAKNNRISLPSAVRPPLPSLSFLLRSLCLNYPLSAQPPTHPHTPPLLAALVILMNYHGGHVPLQTAPNGRALRQPSPCISCAFNNVKT